MKQLRVRDGAAVWREVDGETVVLDVEASAYLGINRTGSVLWPALVRGTDERELKDLLLAEFDVDEAQAEAGVADFLSLCRQRNLLEG